MVSGESGNCNREVTKFVLHERGWEVRGCPWLSGVEFEVKFIAKNLALSDEN